MAEVKKREIAGGPIRQRGEIALRLHFSKGFRLELRNPILGNNTWERNGERESRPGSIEAHRWNSWLLTRRWRKTDSNPRSPLWSRSVRGGPTVSLLPLQTRSGQPRSLADYREASARNSSALQRIDSDARFSSKCAIEEVPGIGSMAGERCSSQASAIWPGVAPWLWAIRASGEFALASLPAASWYQGRRRAASVRSRQTPESRPKS